MSKYVDRWSCLIWAALAALVGWFLGLPRLFDLESRRALEGGQVSFELAAATIVALFLAFFLLPALLRRALGPAPTAFLRSGLSGAGATGIWVLLAGQVWIKNHPTVELARSAAGLRLEVGVLVTALGLAAVVGLFAPLFNLRTRGGQIRGAVVLVLVAATAILIKRDPQQRQALGVYADLSPPTRNVLLITLDTQRADHFGTYGAEEVRTPHVDELAQAGVQFDRAFSTTNVTMPSHATILTSRWMKEHRLESNFSAPLTETHVTLAEILKRVGYRTAAFTSLFVLDREHSGLMQGMDVVWAPDNGYTASEEAFNRAADWIEEGGDAPYFAWLHSYDVHRPYEPVAPYDTLYYKGSPTDPENMSFTTIPAMVPRPFGVTDLDYYPAMYKGETTYQDDQLGALVARLRQADLFDNTLIIITADHGESLGEHGFYYSHDALFKEDVHVPLIFHAPGLIQAGLRSGALVQTIDILPTVLDLLGLPKLSTASGVSLQPLLEGTTAAVRERAYFEGQSYRAVGVLDDTWSFIYPVKNLIPNNNVSLFRAVEDPRQERNLFYLEREVAENYVDIAEEFTGRKLRTGPATKAGVPATLAEQLRALGYVE